MASLLPRLLRLKRTGIPSVVVETRPPLFQRVPPWWARYTWGLIACDIFMTGSAIDLTWNHWSTLVTDLEKISTKNEADSPPPEEYVKRPTWQRLGLCTAHFTLGVGCAVALMVTQIRFVRTFAILPPLSNAPARAGEQRRVFVQCAHNWKNNGLVFPMSKCSLEEGRDEEEMIFRVNGERGHWYIGLNDAVIHGQRAPIAKARTAVLAEWTGGKRVGHWSPTTVTDSRWKSGPVRRVNR